jgi:hypothetical protein
MQIRQANLHFLNDLFLRYVLEGFLEQSPERLHRFDECTLGGGVRALHCGTKADNIQPGIFAQNHRTLQTGMVYLNDAVFAEELFVFLE